MYNTRFKLTVGLVIFLLFVVSPTGVAISKEDSTDLIFSQRYIADQIKKAEKGEINWQFVQLLGQSAEKAIEKGWYDSAFEKLKPLLEIYEKGKVHLAYVAGTATRLGLVLMHKKQWKEAAAQLEKAVGIWESYDPSSNTKFVKREYLQSLVYLGQVYQIKQDARSKGILQRALRFAQKEFGNSSQEAITVGALLKE